MKTVLYNKFNLSQQEGRSEPIVSYTPQAANPTPTYGRFKVHHHNYEHLSKQTDEHTDRHSRRHSRKQSHRHYTREHLVLTDTTENENRDIYYYHFTKWPTDMYPLGSNLMDFVDDIQNCYTTSYPDLPSSSSCDDEGVGEEVGRIVVHDVCGSTRAVLLSLVIHLTEQLRSQAPFVDVYSAVQNVMLRRRGVLCDIDDYNYLYKVLWSVMQHVHNVNSSTDQQL